MLHDGGALWLQDPKLGVHLAHFGINMMVMEKTEKTVAEMELEQNIKHEWGLIQESGADLKKACLLLLAALACCKGPVSQCGAGFLPRVSGGCLNTVTWLNSWSEPSSVCFRYMARGLRACRT